MKEGSEPDKRSLTTCQPLKTIANTISSDGSIARIAEETYSTSLPVADRTGIHPALAADGNRLVTVERCFRTDKELHRVFIKRTKPLKISLDN